MLSPPVYTHVQLVLVCVHVGFAPINCSTGGVKSCVTLTQCRTRYVAVTSTTVVQTPLKYVRASLHTPTEVFVAVADTVFDAEKLSDGDLDIDTDEDAALDPDTEADSERLIVVEPDSDLEVVSDGETLRLSVGYAVTDADSDRLVVIEPDSDRLAVTDADSDRLVVIEPDSDRLAVTDADSDRLVVLEPDSDLEVVLDGETLRLSVGSTEVDADTLRLVVGDTVSVRSMDAEAVVVGVKLGETGLFVTDGVGVGDGIISV